MAALDRITFDSDVMGGRACIRGMRLPVSTLVDLVADGLTVEEIIKEYPVLDAEDARRALDYRAKRL